MSPADRALVRKLVVAVLLKLAVLSGIWFFFFRDHRVNPAPSDLAVQVLGQKLQTQQENRDVR